MSGGPEAVGLLDHIWAVLSVPLGWVWTRLAKLEARQRDHELKTAGEYMTRQDIHSTIDATVRPLREDIQEIKADVKALLRQGRD